MKDQDKTKAQLIDELKSLRKSLAAQHEEGNTFKREVQKVKDQKIEQALKESEEKFRTICENAPVMISSFGENGRCLFMNREIEKTLGWTPKELKASDDPLSLVYPDSKIRKRVLESIKRADGLFRKYQVHAKDGSICVQMWADFRLPDNSAISIGYDITEHKRMEERLSFFIDAINSSSDCFIITDPERNITYVNSAATDLFGYTQEEFLGMHVSSLDADSSDADKIIAAVMKKGEWHGEIIEKRKNGSLFDCNLRACPVRDEKNEIIGMMGILRDITAQKQAEEKIKAALKEKEVLLREVHHRVKNNLQMISSLFDLQAQYSTDKKTIEACVKCQSRIKSIALIHEKLYQSKDFTKISLNEYIQSLTGHLFQLSGIKSDAIQLKLNVDDVTLDISSTIHLGLIIRAY